MAAPEATAIRVQQSARETIHLSLPDELADWEPSDAELESVARRSAPFIRFRTVKPVNPVPLNPSAPPFQPPDFGDGKTKRIP